MIELITVQSSRCWIFA